MRKAGAARVCRGLPERRNRRAARHTGFVRWASRERLTKPMAALHRLAVQA